MNRTTLTRAAPLAFVLSAALGAAEFHVAPDGAAGGDGSREKPWDLATAFTHPPAAKPGDTIWLHGGTYKGIFHCKLQGTAEAPIVVRACPGERVTLDSQAEKQQDCSFLASGQWVWYWGFELVNTRTPTKAAGGIEPRAGAHQKYINLIVHDVGNSSIGGDSEVCGCLFYNIGQDGSYLLHPIYCQNDSLDKPFKVVDCIIGNNYGFGIHAYGENGKIRGQQFIGNVWFGSGRAHSAASRIVDNLIVGPKKHPAEGILLKENMGWAVNATDRSLALGRYQNTPKDIALTGNYFKGDTQFANAWQSVTMTGNTFYPPPTGQIDIAKFSENTYLKDKPEKNVVFVRPNPYEPKRAHVVVYNWEGKDSVAADVSKVLAKGDAFEVRNAQNYFAKPVLAGTYPGEPLSLPMTGLEPAQPIHGGKIEPSERTGKEFNAFVLIGTAAGTAVAPAK